MELPNQSLFPTGEAASGKLFKLLNGGLLKKLYSTRLAPSALMNPNYDLETSKSKLLLKSLQSATPANTIQ
jgi:hypothetical protein